jgi:hypothetical protein
MPDIAAQHDAFRVEILCRRIADAVGDIRIEFVGYAPTDVIRFETVDIDVG